MFVMERAGAPNIIRYFDLDADPRFRYVALERAFCSLADALAGEVDCIPVLDHDSIRKASIRLLD